jgi:hypothetical protein
MGGSFLLLFFKKEALALSLDREGLRMGVELEGLFAQLQVLEAEIERRLGDGVAERRAVIDAEVAALQRRLRVGVWRYLRESRLRHVVVAPVIYAMVVPFALLDVSLLIYQWVCFSAWGIPRVRRGDHVVIDRHRLPYLNVIEKVNCVFCGYGNGVIGWAREIAGRTEQFWCPIRHDRRVVGAHARYRGFVAYGDAAGYRARLEEMRGGLK